MKCEIEYEKFRYFVLERSEQLVHHKNLPLMHSCDLREYQKIKLST